MCRLTGRIAQTVNFEASRVYSAMYQFSQLCSLVEKIVSKKERLRFVCRRKQSLEPVQVVCTGSEPALVHTVCSRKASA